MYNYFKFKIGPLTYKAIQGPFYESPMLISRTDYTYQWQKSPFFSFGNILIVAMIVLLHE
jgi:hypothetical protein